jgi:hypothetical protein
MLEIGGALGVAAAAHYGRYVPDLLRHISRNGLSIAGSWHMEHLSDPTDGRGIEDKWVTNIELKQLGQIIRGTAVATSQHEGYPTVTYRVEGKFSNNYLDVVFRDKDNSRVNRSVFLLAVSEAGQCLKGFRIFAGRDIHIARAVECKWSQSRGGASDCYKS